MACLAWAPAAAQIPDEFTNLRVLPADTGKRELLEVMRGFSSALGVRCNHCHVGEDPNSLEGYDFASDEPESKAVARAMMKMVDTINGTLLPATGRESLVEVECVTCHSGVRSPETLNSILAAAVDDGSVAAALDRYRELREEYHGRGIYDFGPGPLNHLAERLARSSGDMDGAIEVMLVNVKLHPAAAYSHLLLGRLHAQKGDREEAIAAMERCLQIEPDNAWARQQLERVKAQE
jgi:hypothetical protein